MRCVSNVLIIVLTWSSTSTVDYPSLWADMEEENLIARNDICWKYRTVCCSVQRKPCVIWFLLCDGNSFHILWSQCFHIYRVMEDNSILWCNRWPSMRVAHCTNWLRLDWRLNPHCCYLLSTVLCCSVIPKCRQQKEINGTLCLYLASGPDIWKSI